MACLTLLPSPSIPSAVREGTKPTHPPTLSPSQSDPFFLPVPPLSPQNPLPLLPNQLLLSLPPMPTLLHCQRGPSPLPFRGCWRHRRRRESSAHCVVELEAFFERTNSIWGGGWKTSGAVSLSGKRIEGVQGWKGHLAKGGLDLLPFFAILLLQKKGLRSQKDPNGRCLTLLSFFPSLLALHSCWGSRG